MEITETRTFTKKVKSWICYDMGNSAYATTVIAAFFPIFYIEYWASSISKVDASIYLNWTLVITNITILITAPILGAVSDINKSTKNILVFFTLTSIFFTSLLFFLDSGL